jgi:DNA invertase Pin-like site-specific DNA recombinase
VYTDEGISAVNTKKRDGFKRMVADALAGKIDLVITKSVITKGRFLMSMPIAYE